MVLSLILAGASSSRADERLKGIACRSVHWGYPGPAGTAFTTTMKIRQSAPGSYFMACGWDQGYFGLQEFSNGKKLAIFSVWDSPEDDKNKLDPAKRVKILHQDPAVRVGRFGGEGSGGQSFYDFDWNIDESYEFLVSARADGSDRTAYSGYFRPAGAASWKHLITFSTITDGRGTMRGFYSFVEDFKRDKVSTQKTRRAEFGPGWVRGTSGDWVLQRRARFTADANPVLNIDAGRVDGTGRLFLATGGDIQMTGPKLRDLVELGDLKLSPPADLPKLP